MERIIKVVGMFFWGETFSTNNRFTMGQYLSSKQPVDYRRSIVNTNVYRLRVDIQTFIRAIFKKSGMAEITLSWALLKVSLVLYIVGLIENFNTWVGGAMSVAGLIGMGCYAYLTYQKARKIRLENDEKEFHLQMKKYGRDTE